MFSLWLYKFRNGRVSVHKLSAPKTLSKGLYWKDMYERMGLNVCLIVDYGDGNKDDYTTNAYWDYYFNKDCTFRRY